MSKDDLAASLGYTCKSIIYEDVYQVPNTDMYIMIDKNNNVIDLIKD